MEEGDGLKYMRARFYDDTTGRFLNQDPLGFRAGVNPYVYCVNNPVNFIDPRGLQEEFNEPITQWSYDDYCESTGGWEAPDPPSEEPQSPNGNYLLVYEVYDACPPCDSPNGCYWPKSSCNQPRTVCEVY